MAANATASVLREQRDGVLTVTLNRPERRNAIDAQMREAISSALDDAALSTDVRALVITGAGGSFCAGGDLGSFEDLHDPRVYRHVSQALSDVMDSLERLEKPTIAAIDGVATGAGLTLALCCDWRIGSGRARMPFREGRLGLVPTHGGVTRVVKLIGLARAKEALLGGGDHDAREALRLGLLNEIAEDPTAAAHDRAQRMCVRAPLSYGAAKRLLHHAADTDLRSAMLAESLAQTALLGSEDHREGLAAARERRQPSFRAR